MDGVPFFVLNRSQLIYGVSDDIHDAAQGPMANRDGNRAALVNRFHPAHHAFGGLHGDAADAAFSEMLLHFERHLERRRNGEALADNFQRLINWRHILRSELHVHGRSRYLNYVSNIFCHKIGFAL